MCVSKIKKKCLVQAISYRELSNRVESDEVPHNEAPHLNLLCLHIQLFSYLAYLNVDIFSVLCFAVNGKQEFNDNFEELITKLSSHSVESEDTQSILRTAQGYICLCRNELQEAKNLLNFRKLGFAVTVNPQNLRVKGYFRLPESQSKFSGPRKFALRYQSLRE